MKKRLFPLALFLFAAVWLTVFQTSAAEPLTSGKYGDNITWTVYDDATLVFSGTGATEENEWWRINDYLSHIYPIESVVIEEGITYLGEYMFNDDLATECIKSLTLPTSLQKIGDSCFIGMTNLQKVFISDLEKWNQIELTSWSSPLINGAALYLNGAPVEHLVVPESITSINEAAFMGCTSLRSVVLHPGVTEIGRFAFNSCPNLEKMVFLGDFPQFGEHVFTQSRPTVYYPRGNSTWPTDSSFAGDTEAVWLSAGPGEVFTDVPAGSWYEDPVDWAVEGGITNGIGDYTFGPDAPCTRGQVVTFLWRSVGCPEPGSGVNPFTDVNESDYFHKAVLWAVELGITNGMSPDSFVPDQPCTRAQVATFLWRMAGKPDPVSGQHSFTDISQGYYFDAVLWAVDYGITNGMTDTTFVPDQFCTRAQIVTFLYRFLSGEGKA